MTKLVLKGRGAIGGVAKGVALVCPESIQGWAGVDDHTGRIIEKGHSQEGVCISDRILVLPCSKGSNGWSCHFHSAMVKGFRPAGWLFSKLDSRAGVAAVVVDVPMVCDFEENVDLFSLIETGDLVEINGDTGEVVVTKA